MTFDPMFFASGILIGACMTLDPMSFVAGVLIGACMMILLAVGLSHLEGE